MKLRLLFLCCKLFEVGMYCFTECYRQMNTVNTDVQCSQLYICWLFFFYLFKSRIYLPQHQSKYVHQHHYPLCWQRQVNIFFIDILFVSVSALGGCHFLFNNLFKQLSHSPRSFPFMLISIFIIFFIFVMTYEKYYISENITHLLYKI